MSGDIASFKTIAPRFEVSDVAAAMTHYIDIFEFQLIDVFGSPPAYAMLARDGAELHLRVGSRPSEAYAWVEHLDKLITELHSRSVSFSGPFNRTSGMREIYISDPWGNAITFGENASS